MKNVSKILCCISLAIFFIAGCTDDGTNPQERLPLFSADTLHEGMIFISASGKKVTLGTNLESAKASDRPSMDVAFDYDYSIGIHEVTCGEFLDLMKDDPESGLSKNCEDDSLPMVNVTYYDAILYANAMSKKAGLDTVYSFGNLSFDANGNCTNMDGLSFRPQVNGFRLPTEAEWIMAAAGNWDLHKSWNSFNSAYAAHKVCMLSADTDSFCDMAGNALEWTNDYLGTLKDSTISDFLGSIDGGVFGERVVKGGSFISDPLAMNFYSRGDVYKVTSSTHAKYVGFRLAIGAIPNGIWMDAGGNVSSDKVELDAGSDDIHKWTGTFKAKLAFRNDESGNLAYVDYSDVNSSLVEIQDTMEVYHPEISPDGNKVAFSTRPEGLGGKSSLYVRNLNRSGSGLVKLKVESAGIPRWYVHDNGDTVIVYVTEVSDNSDGVEFANRSTWEVPFSDGAFGTPKKLFDGNYHGGVSDDYRLAVSGSRLLRARLVKSGTDLESDALDTIWYNGEQACNVSLSKDGSKRTLFLDFGGNTGKDFANKNYGAHEQVLVADSSGNLVQMMAAPSGYSFDHTEWAVGNSEQASNLVVATLVNENGSHERIALLNLADGKELDLVHGSELWHPSFWVKPSLNKAGDSTLDLDSAGVYAKKGDDWGPVLLRYKMELLWRYHDSVEVAILGSSRPLYAISPSAMRRDFFAVNFAHTPNSIYASRDYLERYLWTHLKNLKFVVVSLDLDFWYKNDDRDENFFLSAVDNYPGYAYDDHHDYWKEGIPEGLLEATENGLGSSLGYTYTDDLGRYTETECDSWGDIPELDVDSAYYDDHDEYWENSFAALKQIVSEARERDVIVVGIIFPQSPLYKDTGAFGRYGLRRSLAEKWIDELKDFDTDNENFVLMDENKMGNHDYSSDMAVDQDHLCEDGALQMTTRLNSLLKSLRMK